MQLKQLQSLEKQEKERVSRVVSLLRNKMDQGEEFSAKDLYPEINLDPPYSYCIGNVQASWLLPFYQTLIVDLRPLPTPEHFQNRYGLTVRQFITFVEQGRIALRMRERYSKFADLDYMDDLIRRSSPPPLSTRHQDLFEHVHPTYADVAIEIFRGTQPTDDWWMHEYLDWRQPPSFLEVLANKFALVACYFGLREAERIVIRALSVDGDPGTAYKWLHVFSRSRVYPYMNCLDGVNSLLLEDLELAQRLHGLMPEPASSRKNWFRKLTERRDHDNDYQGEFPFEIGKLLLSSLSLEIPDDLDLATQIVPGEWMKAVRELDKALEQEAQNQLHDKLRNLTELVSHTRQEAAKMERRKQKVANMISIIGLGIIGPLAILAPDPWKPIILAASGTSVLSKDNIAPALVKFAKPSHVATWFDIKRKLTSRN